MRRSTAGLAAPGRPRLKEGVGVMATGLAGWLEVGGANSVRSEERPGYRAVRCGQRWEGNRAASFIGGLQGQQSY